MPSKSLANHMKQFEDFRQLPDDPDSADEAGARNRAMKEPPPGCSIEVWERYLREKWGTTDLMPEGFDPKKLERKRQEHLSKSQGRALNVDKPLPKIGKEDDQALAGYDQKSERTTADSQDSYSIPFPTYSDGDGNSAGPITSASASPDNLEKAAGSKNVAIPTEAPAGPSFYQRLRANAIGTDSRAAEDAAVAEGDAEASTEPERSPTPRIRAGSKPPLSKSAYANSCSDADCGTRGRRPPNYFPFRSQTRKGK